ncbi:hypothetical protein HAX54_018515 [Datura stramonium]|uniref:Uncharacterized protein n=1 Tax=Datura stramonium TaxID=4076 RepID=A0ABS8UPV7_DATST|nr:hypothetical protein [Datura stramonium]
MKPYFIKYLIVTIHKRNTLTGRARADFLTATNNFCRKRLAPIFDTSKSHSPTLVLSSTPYQAKPNLMKHSGRVDKFPCFPYIMVRDKEIAITPDAINSIYWAEPIALGMDSVTGVIDIDKKRDVDAPKSKKQRDGLGTSERFCDDTSSVPLSQDLNDPTPKISRHASKMEPHPGS